VDRENHHIASRTGLPRSITLQSHGIRALRVESDSELLGQADACNYKVKSGDLRPLFERAKKMSQALESFRIDHVYREQNREAIRWPTKRSTKRVEHRALPLLLQKPKRATANPSLAESAPASAAECFISLKMSVCRRNRSRNQLRPLPKP